MNDLELWKLGYEVNMSFAHRVVEGFDIIDLSDSLDLYTVPALKDFCFSLLKKPETKRIMLVMEDLGYIDSSGLGMLINLAHECKLAHVGFKLINLSLNVNKIFTFANAHESFDIYDSEEAAIASNVRSMSYTHKLFNGIDYLFLEGAIDLYCTPEIKKFCRTLLKNENKKILISFSKVNYIDSSGLGMLTNLHFECKQNAIKLKLANLSPESAKIFALTKMNLIFDIYDSLEAAAESMSN